MSRIAAFGEVMMRLTPPSFRRFSDTVSFDAWFGGSEANTLSVLGDLGHEVYMITALPDNVIANRAVQELKKHNIRTDYIERTGGRMGTYYMESPVGCRAASVVYDRKYSSITTCREYRFDEVLKDADWFHYSGITPALSPVTLEALTEALVTAKKYGVRTSCDLNYRGRLWSPEEAQKTMIPLMKYTDVCIANESEAKNCLGIESAGRPYEDVIREIQQTFGFEYVFGTVPEVVSASHNRWAVSFCSKDRLVVTKPFDITPILDRTGAGDAMSGGLIHAVLTMDDMEDMADYALACGVLKCTIPGDLSSMSDKEIRAVMSESLGGIIR